MLIRAIYICLGCLIAWLVVLPALAILGGAVLFLYATLAEITGLLTGTQPRPIDRTLIRMRARRVCTGNFARQ
jgi:hypothetical protein